MIKGLKMRKARLVLDDTKIREIFRLREEEGKSYRQIVKELRSSSVTVKKYLDMGLEGALEYARTFRLKDKTPPKLNDEEIIGDEKSRLWLDSMDAGRYHSYIIGLAYFCAMVEKKPTELINEAIAEIKQGKLLNERSYFMYLKRFEGLLKEVGFADTTQNNYLTAVRSFYGSYEIEMPKKRGGRKRRKRPLRENANVEITREDIQKLLDVSKYLRDKALIFAVTSSGLGRAELRLLDVGDFVRGYDEETGISMLKDVWRVKTGNDFISFFSSECSAMIWQYLEMERGIRREEVERHLNEPLFTATKNTWKGAKGLTSRLEAQSIDGIFRNLAMRVDGQNGPWETENGNTIYNKFHPHNLRKFFSTQMKLSGCLEILVEFMMGHQIESTREAYDITKPKDLKEIYLKFMPAVIIQPTETQVIQSKEYKELKEKIAIYDFALKERNHEVEELKKELAIQRELIEEMRKPLPAVSEFDIAFVQFLMSDEGKKVLSERVRMIIKEEERKK